MFILFGTRGIKHVKGDGNIIKKSCPSCNDGNLVNKLYRRWFTLFFIPTIPLDEIDKFYECDACGSAYNENIKSTLSQTQKEQFQVHKQSKSIYAKATVAVMTHMAIIDGNYNAKEDVEILNIIKENEPVKMELLKIIEKIKTEKNDEFVFGLLNEARNMLSSESLLNIISNAGRVLLADGRIAKEEEILFKEYLIACGLPKSMYVDVITKLKNKSKTGYLSS